MRATDSAAEPVGQTAQTEKAGAPVKLGKFSKHHSHKRYVARTRKSSKTASKTAEKTEKTASASQDSDKQTPLPPAVANANAQMPGVPAAADEPKTEAGALASNAGKILATNTNQADTAHQTDAAQPQADATTASDPAPATAAADVVPADELNDVDRAMADNKPAAPTLALASIDAPASATDATTGQSVTSEDSTWNQTSLIGKVFIAFGGLLTLASAARMFIA
jgi:hypothetical protein